MTKSSSICTALMIVEYKHDACLHNHLIVLSSYASLVVRVEVFGLHRLIHTFLHFVHGHYFFYPMMMICATSKK